jgi:antitoxin MazE
MKANIIAIGNSKGIRIPKALLEQCGFAESVEIQVEDSCLVLSPAAGVREGWEDAFKAMAAKRDDKLIETPPPKFDESDWQSRLKRPAPAW